MTDIDLTVGEFVQRYKVDEDGVEYVFDIGADSEEYGLKVSGDLHYQGEKFSVVGSVVLDPKTGDSRKFDEKNEFVAYTIGTHNEKIPLFQGDEAYTVMERLYQNQIGTTDIYQPESNLDGNKIA